MNSGVVQHDNLTIPIVSVCLSPPFFLRAGCALQQLSRTTLSLADSWKWGSTPRRHARLWPKRKGMKMPRSASYCPRGKCVHPYGSLKYCTPCLGSRTCGGRLVSDGCSRHVYSSKGCVRSVRAGVQTSVPMSTRTAFTCPVPIPNTSECSNAEAVNYLSILHVSRILSDE